MKIRKATRKDLRELMNLQMELEEFIKKKFAPELSLDKIKRVAESDFKKNLGKSRNWFILVAEHEGNMIGFVKAKIKKDEWTRGKYRGLIADVFIKKEWRGKGVTKRLLREAIKIMKERGVRLYEIFSNIDNKRAIKAWKSVGFEESMIMLEKKI